MNIEDIRKELHMSDEIIALNAGSWGPLCQAARLSIRDGYSSESSSRGDDPDAMRDKGSGLARYSEVVAAAKKVLSRFIGSNPDEIALCDSTTTGMNIFMWGYDWKPGDEIIAGSLENPAAKVPLMILAKRRGVKLTYINQFEGTLEQLSEKISDKTRMVLLSDVNFATGGRVDLKEASRLAHEHDSLLLADGIQAVGTSFVDVKKLDVDGYALARHKFLCGPDGAGALYVSKDAMEVIEPTYSGVFSDAHHGSGELTYPDSAQRYEVSTRPLPVIQGGTAATEWIMDEISLPFIVKRTTMLYGALWDGLNDISKVDLVSARDQNSLLSFRVKGVDPKQMVDEFRKHYIFTRTVGALDPPVVRVAVGFWNRSSDVEKIIEVVTNL
ncbi:aminotransferase class V-fold PLP-dependent enzyme [Candidatus Bathyarchaeota archaeon]|jgi:L-cysteine/cystine lyase|nr:aminotransferase class V-fold PLP-dependent enzyme [Candidatus Bathyarchaeota archaeon]MBT4321223.1 aminotransferase class V-fold PLP-dependent enzyme [Candidatus Bathyarchaeota archaeon]MBT4423624.1 aminotransferase class V-fold PLP-dependent enzyme [Candidatus Bathyarchaeota archaeon]MBT6605815.1 aminotransferase class V-fold PLP-dependent enzyme [Candidatus Bathyarchaeota archaeon]MBT7185967.1 aminotransferase class V-fold PLP-dependent enzyme [Candidatus Bathyarchaeota archaeon]